MIKYKNIGINYTNKNYFWQPETCSTLKLRPGRSWKESREQERPVLGTHRMLGEHQARNERETRLHESAQQNPRKVAEDNCNL